MKCNSCAHSSCRRAVVACWLLATALMWSFAVEFAGAHPMDRPLPPPQRSGMGTTDKDRPPPPPPPPGRPGTQESDARGAMPPPRPPPQRSDETEPAELDQTQQKQQEDLGFIIQKNVEKDEQTEKRPDPPGAAQKEQLLSQIRLHQPPPRPPPQLHQPPPHLKRPLTNVHERLQRHQQHQRLPQQQQYQYARPLPPEHQRGPPPRRQQPPPRHQGGSGGIKMLWQQVERGLDGLADLEDAVSDKAKSFLPWGGRSTKPAWKALPPPPEKQTRPEERREDTDYKYGQSRPTVREERYAQRGEARKQAGAPLLERAAARHEVIGANGGASLPSRPMDQQQQETKTAQKLPMEGEKLGLYSHLPVQQRPPEERQDEKQDTPFVATGQRRASIYEGSQQTTKEQPKRALPRSNPLSELNVMPVQRQGDRDTIRPARLWDDDESTSIFSKLAKIIPPLPRLPFSKLLGRGSNSYQMYADASMDAWRQDDEESRKKKGGFLGLFRRHGPVLSVITTPGKADSRGRASLMPPVAELLSRSKHGNSTCLLSDQDIRNSRSIGKSRAALDVACLAFLLFGVREILPYLTAVTMPQSLADIDNVFMPELRNALSLSFDSWAWFGFVAAFLASKTNSLLHDSRTKLIASSVGSLVEGATEYGQLFLRLVAAVPVEKHVPEYTSLAAESQFAGVSSAARLQYFVTMVLSIVILMTVSIVRPVVVGILVALLDVISLPQLRHWPLKLGEIATSIKDIVLPLGDEVTHLVGGEIRAIVQHPLKLSFVCSVVLAMFAMSILPNIEQRRPVGPPINIDDDDEEASPSAFGNFETVANLGTSSASRVDLFAKTGTIESILERWQTTRPEPSHIASHPPMHSMLRLLGYGLSSAALAAFPILLHHMLGLSSDLVPPRIIQVDSLVDSSLLLLFVLSLTWKAMRQLVYVSDSGPVAVSFLSSLDGAVNEVIQSQQASQMNLQLVASISPTKGLAVTDLWAAHTAKRAWAVRGAHLTCRNGEVVVILGDDSAGKSRLLTSISEAIVAPPRRALSTTKVRGSISLGGLDVSKWDRAQLKRRVGLVLNDVRTVSDTAELVSGLTLEEILEPMDGIHNPGEPHTLSTHEKNAMNLALQITGLSATLLPRLPSKLSTVVTANEDELNPSPLRPRCNALSPAEWSKLLLARALTQTILDNDNPASSDRSPEKSLIGSLLLLDDVTVHMSEVEEANLIATLRKTGAASLVTSHKWATGRFADRIVVIKDGAIVENGTHNELLARGPQQSIYAQKWHAMTTL